MKPDLKTLADAFKGKGGGPDSESTITASKCSRTITVWSDNKDVSRLLERCPKGVVSVRAMGGGVAIEMDPRYFRGIDYAFKVAK